MIRSFHDRGTEDIFNRRDSAQARRSCPASLWAVARRKLDMLNAAVSLTSLRVPPGNALEALKGERSGRRSIRINDQDQFRACFIWTTDGPADVAIVDYH